MYSLDVRCCLAGSSQNSGKIDSTSYAQSIAVWSLSSNSASTEKYDPKLYGFDLMMYRPVVFSGGGLSRMSCSLSTTHSRRALVGL